MKLSFIGIGRVGFADAVTAADLGFAAVDTGPLGQALHLEHLALHLEHLALLWITMARRDGHHPHFAWAMLEK